MPLAEALGQLREGARVRGLLKEHIAYSLELSTLANALDPRHRAAVADAALAALAAATPSPSPSSSPDRARAPPGTDQTQKLFRNEGQT